ncbi:MAG: hypothetical protein AMXMBFR25_21410 [Lysobacterales bacterium]|nr:hypothetical protein [Xanthomonadales bacterium]
MSKRIQWVTFACDADGETLVEICSIGLGLRRLRVMAKQWARGFGRPFAVGSYAKRVGG